MINPGCLTGRRRPEEYHEPDEAFDRCEEVQTRSPHVRLERQRLARLSKCPHNRGGGRCANSMRTQEAERYMSAPFFVVFRFQATGTSIVPIAWIVSQIRDGLNGPLLTPFSSFDSVPFAHQTHGVNAPVSMPPRLPSTSSLGLVPIGYSCAFLNIFALLFVISYTYVRGRVIPPARLDEHSLTSELSIDVLPDIPRPRSHQSHNS